jgi:micrococcal nuclease
MNDPDQFSFFEETSPFAIEVPVLKVFDGDGFLTKIVRCQLTGNPKDHTEVEAAIRFGFIDAPELEQRGGCEAREFLTTLIGGRKVLIYILMKADTGKSVDRHGRVLAVPYLGDRNIEIEMLLNGWAWVVEKYEPDEIYFDALEIAQRNKRGIWAYDDNVPPWTFKGQKSADRRSRVTNSNPVVKCPAAGCVGSLVRRNGKLGAFYGCSSYPNCRYTRSI